MEITLSGKVWPVKYPLAACCALERQTGKSLFQLSSSMLSGEISWDGAISLIWAGLLHRNRSLSPETVAVWLEEDPAAFLEIYHRCLREFCSSFQRYLIPPKTPEDDLTETGSGGEAKN